MALTDSNAIDVLREHMMNAIEDANLQIDVAANGWSIGQTISGDTNMSFTI